MAGHNQQSESVPDTYRILKTNRDEYLIVIDDGQDLEGLFYQWCVMDDAFCEGTIPESQWEDIATFLTARNVRLIQPLSAHVLADYYP